MPLRGKTGCGAFRLGTGLTDFDALQVSAGAVARWKLDSESGGIFADDVGGYDFTIGNTGDWTTSASGLPNGAGGYTQADGSLAAVTENAAGDVFDVSDGTEWAVEYMYYRTGAPGVQSYIMSLASSSTIAWGVYVDTSGQPNFHLKNTSNLDYITIGVGTVEANRWNHVVQAKLAGDEMKSWLNGRPVGAGSLNGGTVRTPTAAYSLFLGSDGNGSLPWTSAFRVSRFALYNSLPTNAEVKERYLAMFKA